MPRRPKIERIVDIPAASRLVKMLRISKGLTQKEFAEQVLGDDSVHAFKKLSRIEMGLQALSDSDRGAVERYYKGKLEDLVRLGMADADSQIEILTQEQYFEHTTNFILNALKEHEKAKSSLPKGQTPAELWIFGPSDDMPVVNSTRVRTIWLENLINGVDKNLVFVLATSTAEDLQTFLNVAVELLKKEVSLRGKIIFWACDPCAGSSNPRMAAIYQSQREYFLANPVPGLVLQPPLELPDDTPFRRLLGCHTMVLNRVPGPVGYRIAPYAADYLEDVGSNPNIESISGWAFLGQKTQSRLNQIADKLQSLAATNFTQPLP